MNSSEEHGKGENIFVQRELIPHHTHHKEILSVDKLEGESDVADDVLDLLFVSRLMELFYENLDSQSDRIIT